MSKKLWILSIIFSLVTIGAHSDLIHHWALDEATLVHDGTNWTGVMDSVTGTSGMLWGFAAGDDLTQTGLGVLANPGPAGDFAYDLERDSGISGVATNVFGALPATGDFTVLAWIKTTNAHTAQGHIFSNNSGQSGRAGLFAMNHKAGFWAQGFGPVLTSTTDIDDGAWHEIGVCRSGGTFYLFVDGVVEASALYPAVSIDQGTFWMIGRMRSYNGDYEGQVADVKVYNTDYSQVSTRAWNPMPALGQTGVGTPNGASVDVQLSWLTARDFSNPAAVNAEVVTHYLYLSKDQNTSSDPNLYYVESIPVSGDETTPQVALVSLNYDGAYLWRIDEGLSNGQGGAYSPGDPNNIRGFVWSFETLASIPVITNPADQIIDLGQTAVFSVNITSITPVISWQWYKVGSPDVVVDDSDADITIINTQTSSTLEIANCGGDDDGLYYFVARNTGGTSFPTAVAELRVRRLIGRWSLDGNTNDASGNGNHGVVKIIEPQTDPNWVTGIEGMAFNATGTKYIEIPNESFFDAFDRLTVSVWIRGALMPDNNPFVSKHAGIIGWTLDKDGAADRARFVTRNDGSYLRYGPWPVGTTSIQDNGWHHVVAVLDGDAGRRYLYVDGLLEASEAYNPALMVSNDAPVRIAANQFNDVIGDIADNVAIDDVRIYNYALDGLTVARQYTELSGNRVCYAPPALDLNGDCVVDLLDLADLAVHWLDCALVPTCLQ